MLIDGPSYLDFDIGCMQGRRIVEAIAACC